MPTSLHSREVVHIDCQSGRNPDDEAPQLVDYGIGGPDKRRAGELSRYQEGEEGEQCELSAEVLDEVGTPEGHPSGHLGSRQVRAEVPGAEDQSEDPHESGERGEDFERVAGRLFCKWKCANAT